MSSRADRQKLVDELVQDESLRLKPYVDTVGKITIGIGRNLTDVGISRAEAFILLDNDINAAVTDLARFAWFTALDPVRQRVLTNMRFQLGAAEFMRFRIMIAAVAREDYRSAAAEIRHSKLATQAPARTERHAERMEDGGEA